MPISRFFQNTGNKYQIFDSDLLKGQMDCFATLEAEGAPLIVYAGRKGYPIYMDSFYTLKDNIEEVFSIPLSSYFMFMLRSNHQLLLIHPPPN